jgi:hypothetical protein
MDNIDLELELINIVFLLVYYQFIIAINLLNQFIIQHKL